MLSSHASTAATKENPSIHLKVRNAIRPVPAPVIDAERVSGFIDRLDDFLSRRAVVKQHRRLLRRFGANWRVLFSHLVLFGFIYPHLRHQVPSRLTDQLAAR